MSTQPAPALATQPEPAPAPPPPKEIPELTDAYRKAHKSYVLASGLLASWELIGITLQTKEKWGIELKSPTAVPLILFVLVIYSGYKMTIEWMQCHPERQKHPAAKWDYRIAHAIALTAVAISIVQYLLHIQIVDFLARHENTSIRTMGVLVLIFFFLAIYTTKVFKYPNKLSKTLPWLLILAIMISALSGIEAFAIRRYAPLLTSIPWSLVAFFVSWLVYKDRKKGKMK